MGSDGRDSTFGKQLMSYVSERLPYGKSYEVLDNINMLNPKYKDFYKAGSSQGELLSKHSVSTQKPGGEITE